MNRTDERIDTVIAEMFNDHSTRLTPYHLRCYANRLARALRRERANGRPRATVKETP